MIEIWDHMWLYSALAGLNVIALAIVKKERDKQWITFKTWKSRRGSHEC